MRCGTPSGQSTEGERNIRHLAEHLPPQDRARADRFVHEATQARRQSEAVRQLVNGREALKAG
jgi:hypothetical protein